MTLVVHETFVSIQGESTHAGRPCFFIRLSGCNLRCAWCDTRAAWTGGQERSLDELLALARDAACPLVEVTGGEPLLQAETPALVSALCRGGFEVLVETNGSLDISPLDPAATAIVDIKCPSSGESKANDLGNLARLRPADELKFVLADRTDYVFARDLVREMARPGRAVHFSPVFGTLDPKVLAAWMLEDRLAVRLGLQWHKYIWGPEATGV